MFDLFLELFLTAEQEMDGLINGILVAGTAGFDHQAADLRRHPHAGQKTDHRQLFATHVAAMDGPQIAVDGDGLLARMFVPKIFER